MHLLTALFLAISSNLDNLGVALAYGTRKIQLPLLSNLVIAFITSCGTLITMLLGKYIADYILTATIANYIGASIIIAAGFYVIVQSYREAHLTPYDDNKDNSRLAYHSLSQDATRLIAIRLRSLGILIEILRDPVQVDSDSSGTIDLKEAAVMGLALTLNNLATGFGAGVSGLNPALTTAMVFLLSLLFCSAGVAIGRQHVSRWLGNKTSTVAGLLLVLIGFYELFI